MGQQNSSKDIRGNTGSLHPPEGDPSEAVVLFAREVVGTSYHRNKLRAALSLTMTPRRNLCILLAHLAALALALATSPPLKAVGEAPCSGGGIAAEEAARFPEDEDEGRSGWTAVQGKRVGFNSWGGKRQGAGELPKSGGRSGTRAEEADKRVGFNAWGGKRSQFSAWGGKRVPLPDSVSPRAFFPWGGKRDSGEEDIIGTEEDDGQREAAGWGSLGQPEETTSSREGEDNEVGAAWGRPFGRGRRSSSRSQLTATMSDPLVSDAISWERKRLAALWRAGKLQPARQNRRAVGADFFPWGGKRAGFAGAV